MPKAFTKAFLEAFGKNFPIQEQEQEQNESIVDSQGESDDTLLNFESLWKNYPNKDGKKEALKYFKADIKQGVPVTDIKQAQDNYLAHLKANPWKQPKTGKVWFNNWRDWLNWQEPEKPKGNVTSESDEDVYYDAAGRRLSLK
ncbi:MAG: hypothetical protein OEW04_03545 [Nitrospirota bacterium]|nr:hypothetical protein [Nitrospirota bacterium]